VSLLKRVLDVSALDNSALNNSDYLTVALPQAHVDDNDGSDEQLYVEQLQITVAVPQVLVNSYDSDLHPSLDDE
jgi:hypothetical protein